MTVTLIRIQPVPTTKRRTDSISVIDEETLERFEKIAVRRLVRQLDWRILPFMFLLEVGSYINRVSMGHARLMGIESDLHLSQSESNWNLSIFALFCWIFAIPNTILMRYLGPTRYLSMSMLAWGGITVGMAFVRNARDLLIVRVLLGITEAGFFPGIIIYFSLWYRKRDHVMRIAILFGAAIISGALDSILAYGFAYMDGIRGLSNWQWMFLLEGLPMIPLGIITYLFLGNLPDTVQWLDNSGKQLLTNLLRNDAGITHRENARLSWRQVLYVFIDCRVYLFVLIGVGNVGMISYLTSYFPLVVKGMSDSDTKEHLMTAPLYVVGFVCCLLASYSSSRRNEHTFHLIVCLSIGLLGFILILTLVDRGNAVLYVSSCIAYCGVSSALPILLSWLTNNICGHTKRTIAIGFVMGTGQIAGIILPLVSRNESIDRRDTFICIGAVAATLVLVIILRICFMLENRRRERLSPEKRAREAAVKEPCDRHPQVRYVY